MADEADAKALLLSAARVQVELGELYDAELLIAQVLDGAPDDLDALSLLAKVKHMRGELSQAIACWAQIQALAPPSDGSMLQLQSIFQMATDPERWAGDFVALSQVQRVRRPAAFLELEEAFGDFAARRVDAARVKCLQTATRHRSDREAYKLATLAAAWICELAGRSTEACRILEALGSERGFETDPDRVLMLARLYEADGATEHLESTLHIWQYLEKQSSRLENSCRLGALNRRLGRLEAARFWEERYLLALRRRMHRPSPQEILLVAARRYLPLPQLLELPVREASLDSLAPPRARALDLALHGDRGLARRQLAGLGTLLDRKYLADLELTEGNTARATAEYLACLAADPTDLKLIGWLLEHHRREPSGEIARALAGPLGEQVKVVLEAAQHATPLRPSLWRQRATLARIAGASDEDVKRLDERADALERASWRESHAIGRSLSAAVYRFIGRTKGLIHEVWADRELAGPGRGGTLPENRIYGNLEAPMKQAIQSTFLSVREYARSTFPHLAWDVVSYTYSFHVTKEDEPSWGLSVGLPAAIAFLSVFLQRPVPQTVASSGVLVADAHDVLAIRPVGDVEYKVKAAYHRNLRQLVLPAANERELAGNPRIPGELRAELVRFAGDLSSAVELVFGREVFGAELLDKPRGVTPVGHHLRDKRDRGQDHGAT